MKNLRNFLLILSLLLVVGLLLPANAQAASPSKKKLVNKIKKVTSQKILSTYYDDFDMDGNMELFAITDSSDGQHLWYASKSQTRYIFDDLGFEIGVGKKQGVVTINKKQKLFLAEYWGAGAWSRTIVCYVNNNKIYTVEKTGEGIEQISGKNFAVYPGAYDHSVMDGVKTGHTWKRYYIYWTGKGFKEYKGTSISQSAFKKYTDGSKILSKITKAGYKIGKIYKRPNNIININCYTNKYGDRWNENVTCSLKKNKVKVVIYDKNGRDIVEQSSYGGVYKASGY